MEKKIIKINKLSTYLNLLHNALNLIEFDRIEKIVDILYEAYLNNNQVFIIGNGGSSATASHFACDLGKGDTIHKEKNLRVMSLTDNVSLLTATANDFGYDTIFVKQLDILLNENDVVIAISASGNSPNIVKAAKFAKKLGAQVIGFVGFKGGELKKIADIYIHINIDNYQIVEDLHLILSHMISVQFHNKVR